MRIKHASLPIKRSALWFVASAAFTTSAIAQQKPSLQIDVSGSRESSNSILTPTKILQGNELQDKLGTTLGATIGNELGVSQTGYGTGASRPVMRGLEGARVQILQNGLSVGDVSNISADHAVASQLQNTRQIEILRGAAALLYGSGSSGGLVNIVNDRILTTLPDEATGSVNRSYESVSNGRAAAGHVDTAFGSIAVHVDTAINNNQNYRIPGNSALNGNTNWNIPGVEGVNYTGKLPNSFNNQNNLGLGASYIGQSGYTGIQLSDSITTTVSQRLKAAQLISLKIVTTSSIKLAIHLLGSPRLSSVQQTVITTILNLAPRELRRLCGRILPMKLGLN